MLEVLQVNKHLQHLQPVRRLRTRTQCASAAGGDRPTPYDEPRPISQAKAAAGTGFSSVTRTSLRVTSSVPVCA